MSGTSVRGRNPQTSREVCPECNGRGWKIVADGGAGTAIRCDCAKRERTAIYLDRAGIPDRYRRCRLSNFKTSNADPNISRLLLEARKTSELYVDHFFDPKDQRFRSSGLIFVGPPGIGKTHLAAAVLSEAIERYQVRGRFVDFTVLLHQIQSTFDAGNQDTKHSILAPVIEAELLVLDELGAQKPTEWVMNTLYLIMNSRYTERRPTIFTTNYHLDPSRSQGKDRRYEALDTRISPQLVSRLFEMGQPVVLGDFDYRREVMMYQHRLGR